MSNSAPIVNQWSQLRMFDAEVVKITLEFGVVRQTEHVQVMVRSTDELNGALLSMWSIPHGELSNAAETLRRGLVELSRLVEEFTGPF